MHNMGLNKLEELLPFAALRAVKAVRIMHQNKDDIDYFNVYRL